MNTTFTSPAFMVNNVFAQFLKTAPIDDVTYIDLLQYGDSQYTMVMVKDKEPNQFKVKEKVSGDCFDAKVLEYTT